MCRSLRQQLAQGAELAGRTGSDLTIAPLTNVYVLGEGNDEAQWQAARQPLFHYINRMGDFYWNMLASNGFEAEVTASRAAWKERDKTVALAAVSEEMVRSIQVVGPIEEVAEQLQERAALGADVQMLQMPGGSAKQAGARLEAMLG
jgi:alkanesulfonate monooxygenase SsuD/methylene tetrahydromethanopterin reductase-like flavin-dependent oxidoreductase (luciferase family)